MIDPKTMIRRSVLSEAAEVLADLVVNGSRTICFLKSRRGIELIQRFTRMRLEELGEPGLAARIAPYRAGYTPQQRREIERRLTFGDLLAVVATDALELGIDIGELDAAICVTFPGTVASLKQMWGRAGRRRDGIAVYVAGQDALDQFFCRHPDEFLARPVEAAILDHTNERIQTAHLVAAAFEAPLGGTPEQPGGADDEILGERWRDRADALVGAGKLRRGRDGRYLPRGPGFPAGDISLRSASLDSIAVVERASGRAARPDGGRARVLDRAPGGDLPAPGALLRGRRARHRGPPRDRRRLRRRLVHAAEEGDDGLHRGRVGAAHDRPARERSGSSSCSGRSR